MSCAGRVCVVDVTDSATLDEVYEQVREALQQVLDDADGRPVAARLVLQGSSPVHSALHADSNHWIQEYRALASGLGGAGMWLEKVALETRQAVALDELLERDDALGGLLRAIHTLEMDAAGVEGLAEEVAELRQKLPPELLGGEERYDPGRSAVPGRSHGGYQGTPDAPPAHDGERVVEIRELNLTAFGPFTDRRLDFSPAGGGLHIVYGPNEAGKSSSLRGLKALLFGIPARTTDNFLHDNKDLRIAGTLRSTQRAGTGGGAAQGQQEHAVVAGWRPAG